MIKIGVSNKDEEEKKESPIRRAFPSTVKAQAEEKSTELQNVFSNSLTSFLKVKATKALQYGEVLVKSITRDNKNPSGVTTP